jgi:hypothetical protein
MAEDDELFEQHIFGDKVGLAVAQVGDCAESHWIAGRLGNQSPYRTGVLIDKDMKWWYNDIRY